MNFDSLKDPKIKGIVQLVGYAVFFVIVFVIIGMSNSNSSQTEYRESIGNNTVVEEDENTENNTVVEESKYFNYEYSIRIDDNIILGQVINGNNILLDDEDMENIDVDVQKYLYEQIEKLILESEFLEKTTYKDNSEKTSYILRNYDYCYDCNMIVESKEYIENVFIGDNIEINYIKINK